MPPPSWPSCHEMSQMTPLFEASATPIGAHRHTASRPSAPRHRFAPAIGAHSRFPSSTSGSDLRAAVAKCHKTHNIGPHPTSAISPTERTVFPCAHMNQILLLLRSGSSASLSRRHLPSAPFRVPPIASQLPTARDDGPPLRLP
ncbi:hypothetical protein EW146_g8458 [Bondarzewia mesenterica]|uniref:Uncharacterized protein n=1 Tax=Bondarzewia mesenterica TaxID=1095465 RepID=A0A4S4LEI8_9AGAM|nr:hypothetical protein EW146_g8458 [Bondarzewia mesenterica]